MRGDGKRNHPGYWGSRGQGNGCAVFFDPRYLRPRIVSSLLPPCEFGQSAFTARARTESREKKKKKLFWEDSRTRCPLRMYSRALILEGPQDRGCLLDALNVNFYAVGKDHSLSTKVRKRREEMEQSQGKRKKRVVFFHIYSTFLTCASH